LRPDVQIVCRANQERNISKLHSAGADLVMSYTSMTTNTILGLLRPDDLLMLAEGLNIFRVVVPPAHVGKSLAETHIRSKTGCNVVAICDGADICINPSPSHRLDPDDELVLIGNADAEKRFFHLYAGIEKVRNRSL
jgi:K+/H+ antiporter YhaU regulatory subunit KhtT